MIRLVDRSHAALPQFLAETILPQLERGVDLLLQSTHGDHCRNAIGGQRRKQQPSSQHPLGSTTGRKDIDKAILVCIPERISATGNIAKLRRQITRGRLEAADIPLLPARSRAPNEPLSQRERTRIA